MELDIDLDMDGKLPVEMVWTLLWEQHRGAQFTGDMPWYLQPERPASRARAEQISPEAPAEEEQISLEPWAWPWVREVYQHLHEAMQQELDSDRRFFIENPTRIHMVRNAFTMEARFLREQAHILEGPGTIPDGEMVIVVKELAPGIRLRLRLPPGMSVGWKSVQSPGTGDLFATVDEEHSRHMWESCIQI